ncbi:hypothetical protein [Vibrio parahaemolyticus]
MYKEFFLRAESYEAFVSECVAAGLTIDGAIITASHNHSMILIGKLYKETGVTLKDPEGNDYPETAALPGYHVNVRFKLPLGLEHLAVEPDDVLVQWP